MFKVLCLTLTGFNFCLFSVLLPFHIDGVHKADYVTQQKEMTVDCADKGRLTAA
jgi:hypothetical protein